MYLGNLKESGTPAFTHLSAPVELGIFGGLVFWVFFPLSAKILASKTKLVIAAV